MDKEDLISVSASRFYAPKERFFQKGEMIIIVGHSKDLNPADIANSLAVELDNLAHNPAGQELAFSDLTIAQLEKELATATNCDQPNLLGGVIQNYLSIKKEIEIISGKIRNCNDEKERLMLENEILLLNNLILSFDQIHLQFQRRIGRLFSELLSDDNEPLHHKRIKTLTGNSDNQNSLSFFASVNLDDSFLQDDLSLLFVASIYQFALTNNESTDNREAENAFVIKAISPSWFFVSAMGDVISGGPGALPIPVQRDNFTIDATTTSSDSEVDIFILDSIPSEAQINQARRNYTDNRLLMSLKAKEDGNRLTFDRYQYVAADEDEAYFVPSLYTVKNQPFDYSDHGHYIAGLIHERLNSNKVNLELIEVLNLHGVGTIDSVISGLSKLNTKLDSNKNSIVNLSFHITLPSDAPLDCSEVSTFLKEQNMLDLALLVTNLLLLFLRNEINRNVVIVSAVGNDSTESNRVRPRLPAALSGVEGVGSADSFGRPRVYSNMPTSELENYVFADGGGINHRESSRINGLPGVFTVPYFPHESENLTGWGVWAGTSFATAIVSAKIASRILATNEDSKTAMDFLKNNASVSVDTGVGDQRVPQIEEQSAT